MQNIALDLRNWHCVGLFLRYLSTSSRSFPRLSIWRARSRRLRLFSIISACRLVKRVMRVSAKNGFPFGRDNMRTLATCDNVTVKLGGATVVTGFPSYDATLQATSVQLASEFETVH